jgi:hypothetical protein
MTLELQITSEDYYYLTCDNITSIPLGTKEYPLQLWEAIEVWSSDREERMRVYVTGIAPIPEAGAIVVRLKRLRFEWEDDEFSILKISTAFVADNAIRLQVYENYQYLWNAELQGYGVHQQRNLPSKIDAQLAAEGLLKQLTIDLCRLHGAILYYP